MNKRTLKITTGAAILAIFAIMLIINRQTGLMFEEFFMYLFPIPMIAFSAQYGWKSSIPLLICMGIFSFLFGTFTTIFYATSEALIGLVLGDGIYRKANPARTIVIVMAMSAAANVLNSVVLADLFGFSITETISEMESMINSMIAQTAQSGVVIPENLFSHNYLLQVFVVSMVLMGGIQGFVIYQFSLLILRRLRFQIPEPKSIYTIFPPKWTGILAFASFFLYNHFSVRPLANEMMQNSLQAAGLFGYIYLACFGCICMMEFMLKRWRMNRLIRVIITGVWVLALPLLVSIFGLIYIMGRYHESWNQELGIQ